MDTIRKDQPCDDVEYAGTATLVGIKGQMASYSGQLVTWEQMLQSTVRLAPETYASGARPPVVPGPDGRYPVAMPGVTMVP